MVTFAVVIPMIEPGPTRLAPTILPLSIYVDGLEPIPMFNLFLTKLLRFSCI